MRERGRERDVFVVVVVTECVRSALARALSLCIIHSLFLALALARALSLSRSFDNGLLQMPDAAHKGRAGRGGKLWSEEVRLKSVWTLFFSKASLSRALSLSLSLSLFLSFSLSLTAGVCD